MALTTFEEVTRELEQETIVERNYSQNWTRRMITLPLRLIPQTPYVLGNAGGNVPLRRHSFPSVDDIGTRLADLYHERPRILLGADEEIEFSTYDQHARMGRGRVEKISIRVKIQGPGMNYITENQVTMCSVHGNRSRPYTKAKAGSVIARVVKKLFDQYGGQLNLGNGVVVRFDRAVLLTLVAVSSGSWQPILAYY